MVEFTLCVLLAVLTHVRASLKVSAIVWSRLLSDSSRPCGPGGTLNSIIRCERPRYEALAYVGIRRRLGSSMPSERRVEVGRKSTCHGSERDELWLPLHLTQDGSRRPERLPLPHSNAASTVASAEQPRACYGGRVTFARWPQKDSENSKGRKWKEPIGRFMCTNYFGIRVAVLSFSRPGKTSLSVPASRTTRTIAVEPSFAYFHRSTRLAEI